MLKFLAGAVLGWVVSWLWRMVVCGHSDDAVPLSIERRQMLIAQERQDY